MLKRNITLLIFILIAVADCKAQGAKKITEKEYASHPYWIQMMDDPDVNYFEAVKAYEIYWQHHEKPMEENEIIGTKGHQASQEKHKENFLTRLFGSGERESAQKYAFECKKFEHWKMKSEPYVQPDGRILTAEERLEIWKKKNQ